MDPSTQIVKYSVFGYALKASLGLALFIFLSFSKGWTGVFLVFYLLPILFLMLVLLFGMFREYPKKLSRFFTQILVSAWLVAFLAPLTTDTSQSSAFTIIQTDGGTLSLISGALATIALLVLLINILRMIYVYIVIKKKEQPLN